MSGLRMLKNVLDHIMDKRGLDDESCNISNQTAIYSQPIM
jgi:hypothetical protein